MASTSQQYALVLFDLHGETSVINTKKLRPQILVKPASRPHLFTATRQYLVEVLEISVKEEVLKSSQQQWAKSHRSLAIEKEMDRRADDNLGVQDVAGGYLDIWPEDAENQNSPPQMKKRTRQPCRPSTNTSRPNRKPLTTKRQLPTNQTTVRKKPAAKKSKPTVNDSNAATEKFPYALEGSNGRKLTVLFEGAGDYGNQEEAPKRQAPYLEDISPDERDIVQLQIQQHARGRVSRGTQTDTVIIIASDEEAVRWFKFKHPSNKDNLDTSSSNIIDNMDTPDTPSSNILDTPDTPTSNILDTPDTPTSNILDTPDTPTSNILDTPDTPTSNILDTPDTPASNILDTPDTPTSNILDTPTSNIIDSPSQSSLSVHQKLDQILHLLRVQKNRPRQSVDFVTSVLNECDTILPIIDTHHSDTSILIPDNHDSEPVLDNQTSETDPVDEGQTTITNFYLPVTNQPTILQLPSKPTTNVSLSLPAPTVPSISTSSSKRTLQPCFQGPVVEIKSNSDIASVDTQQETEVRVQFEAMWKIKDKSCSVTNFAWNLAKEMYTKEELIGCNYSGKKGKTALSPRRKHAMEHAISDCYGPEYLLPAANAINMGIRNIDRKQKTV